MKIKVTQEKLSKALTCISRIAINKSTLPILGNILIRVEDKKVSLITTNLDMAIISYLPVSESENGVITVPAKLITEFVSNLPKGENIEISTNDTKVSIKAGKYSSTINGTIADDFPELPEIDEKNAVIFKTSAEDFKNSIGQVIIASSNDLTRPALTGLCFDTNNGSLYAVSTDGYRLAKKEMIKKVESEVKAIVPSSTLHEVLRTISDDTEEIEISFNEDLVEFKLDETRIVSKLIDASYPDYTALIPKNNDTVVTLDRDELMRTIKLAALFARSVDGSIICEAKAPDSFSVRSIANEFGENDSNLQTTVEKDSKTRLNSRFFIDALNSIGSKEVIMEFSSSVKPIVIHGKNDDTYTHIIMPLNK